MVRQHLWTSTHFYMSPTKADMVEIPCTLLKYLTETLCYAACTDKVERIPNSGKREVCGPPRTKLGPSRRASICVSRDLPSSPGIIPDRPGR